MWNFRKIHQRNYFPQSHQQMKHSNKFTIVILTIVNLAIQKIYWNYFPLLVRSPSSDVYNFLVLMILLSLIFISSLQRQREAISFTSMLTRSLIRHFYNILKPFKLTLFFKNPNNAKQTHIQQTVNPQFFTHLESIKKTNTS